LPRRRFVGRLVEQIVHALADMVEGLRSQVDAEDRQHAAHLRQQLGDGRQFRLGGGVAEVGVQQALDRAHVMAQFLHDAAQGLRFRALAIQFFHPGGEVPGGGAFGAAFQSLGELGGALQEQGIVRLEVGERGLEEEQGGGHFEHALGRQELAILGGGAHHAFDGGGQGFGSGRDFAQCLRELLRALDQLADAAEIGVAQLRPAILDLRNAFAGLLDEGGVDQAEIGTLVVHPWHGGQAHMRLDGMQRGRRGLLLARAGQCLGAEKQQFVREALGGLRLAGQQTLELQVQAVAQALDVDVGRQQTLGHGFEQTSGHPPQGALVSVRGGLGAPCDNLHGGRRMRDVAHPQHVEQGALVVGSVACLKRGRRGLGLVELRPGPVEIP
jgi:hypothetical protein